MICEWPQAEKNATGYGYCSQKWLWMGQHMAWGAWLLLIGWWSPGQMQSCHWRPRCEHITLCCRLPICKCPLCVSREFFLPLVAPLPKCSVTWKPRARVQQEEGVPFPLPALLHWADLLRRGVPDPGTRTAAYMGGLGCAHKQERECMRAEDEISPSTGG